MPIALGSAIWLSRTSYRAAAAQSERAEEQLADSYRLLGQQTLDRIDNAIVDSDRLFFDLVDLDHLQDFARQWSNIVRLSPAIDSALVLDEKLQPVQGASVSKKLADAETFRGVFMRKILHDPDLKIAGLLPNAHKHLHKTYDGREYLISYIRRENVGHSFYIILKINLEYVVKNFFPDVLLRLNGKVSYCVRDGENRVVYGACIERARHRRACCSTRPSPPRSIAGTCRWRPRGRPRSPPRSGCAGAPRCCSPR